MYMLATTKGIPEYRKLFNSRFARVRRRVIVILSWIWIAPTLYAMAADDESIGTTRHISLPNLSILEEIVKATTEIFRDDDEEESCRVSIKYETIEQKTLGIGLIPTS